MNRLLFLSHRIPYPPNKGDKIRSYHLLEYLARRYEVCLGTFIDDESDWQYVPLLEGMCADSYFAGIHPLQARVRSLGSLLTNEALTVGYYRDRGLARWVRRLCSTGRIERVLVFSSAMAQYVSRGKGGIRTVVDMVDIDSDKWRQYSASMHGPKKWIYGREARALAAYEHRIARDCDASVFVSAAEAELFRARFPGVAGRVHHLDNGVDTDYFAPQRAYPNPYSSGQRVMVFTGAMDYWPNVDAVTWFAGQILPRILQRQKDARFYIVGSRPVPSVERLADLPGVTVTGTVEDIRPYLTHAHVVVAPLRLSRGVQNKVLEAMAMAKPVVATSRALEGIAATPDVICADDPATFAEAVMAGLDAGPGVDRTVPSLRRHVLSHYDWEVNLQGLTGLLEGGTVSRQVA